jgi:hypothetical protein
MLGHETHAGAAAPGDERRREALAEACRGVRERLEGIARALATLRTDIDRALVEPSTPGTGVTSPSE